MKKLFLTVLVALFAFNTAIADEGMWLPSVIGHTKLKDMQDKGLMLTAEDLYSVNQASLKDAVVRIDGCTAEIVSDKGLILTNHHCGFDQVQYHSTVENDYLTNGFVAMNLDEELPSYRSSADLLVRMEDVTGQVTKGIKSGMTEAQERALIKKNSEAIIKAATKGTHYNASIEPLFYTNQYFLFVFESFTDVRLVMAPPSSIGKFGGDTDNWVWPRHTGDFTVFRIYADKDNKPAAYSRDNVPYTPKKSFIISVKPKKEGDFTFIYGYPGRTNEYLHSAAVKYIANVGDVHKIGLRTARLDVMSKYMAQDPQVRIKYAAKHANVANAWKKWQGEIRGVKKLGAIGKKDELEKNFNEWAQDKPQYAGLVAELQQLYDRQEKYSLARDYYTEGVLAIEAFKYANGFAKITPEDIRRNIRKYREEKDVFFKDYYMPVDREIAKEILNLYYENLPSEFHPAMLSANSHRIGEWVDAMFESSLFTTPELMTDILNEPDLVIMDAIYNDPVYAAFREFNDVYKNKIEPAYSGLNDNITGRYKDYMNGLMAFQNDKVFYPDANYTLRIAYGDIGGFEPEDGVVYTYMTTLDGVMEKENPNIPDYHVDPKLKELYKNKDYGRWGEDGSMPVCFLASNHTTGGNSGSPVLNGDGELIGINFDRCWESTMSDIVYSEDMCRNIAVDIRYVLFIMDKFSGAGYLIDEMNIKY